MSNRDIKPVLRPAAESGDSEEVGLLGKDILVLSPTPTFPLDQGNRKRIHAYCQELKQRGARIHFLFYPFEWWFTHIPHDAIEQMRAQWDTFHLLPVTKPLQAASVEADHNIDEWWDCTAIEPYLKWLFLRGRYDAFIVNYPYLSKAFEFSPQETVKILDMHDKFTGRRQLLESMGINKEFFYTTAEQEAIALNRADLVWAIKDEEAEFFRSITTTPVITMPHIEPEIRVARKPSGEDEDYLVLGMVGARNNINYKNAVAFFDEVMPILIRNLAPVKIRFGGGMCSDFADWDKLPPGIEMFGRFDKPEDFYESIDIALVPLSFSTGLKIKAVEAFATGLPIIAHAHAVEGIPVESPYHRCQSPVEIAERIMEVAYDRERLVELGESTRQTYQLIKAQFANALKNTIDRIHKRPRIAICVGPEFFDPKSPYRAMVYETLFYLKHAGELLLYFDSPTPTGGQALAEAFYWLSKECKIVLSRRAAQQMGDTVQQAHGGSLGAFHTVMDIAELAAAERQLFLYVLDLPTECLDAKSDFSKITHAFIRVDSAIFGSRRSRQQILDAYQSFPSATLLTSGDISSEPLLDLEPDLDLLPVPYWKDFSWDDVKKNEAGDYAAILTTRPDDAYVQRLIELCEVLLPEWERPRVVVPDVLEKEPTSQFAIAGMRISQVDWMKSFSSMAKVPRFVLDVSGRHVDFSILRETLIRKAVPFIECQRQTHNMSANGISGKSRPVTIGQLANAILTVANNELAPQAIAHDEAAGFANDAGWTKVWKLLMRQSRLAKV